MGLGFRQIVAAGAVVVMTGGLLGGALLADRPVGSGGGSIPSVVAQLPKPRPAGVARIETVGLAGATSARVEVELGTGALRLGGGTLAGAGAPLGPDHLLRGEFVGAEAAPALSYRIDSRTGRLRLVQPDGAGTAWRWGEPAERWDLYLNPTVPTDLRVAVGAGESRLALGGLSLTGLDVATGAGATTLDLAGDWRAGLSGRVHGGAGDLTLRLPRAVGVRVEVDQGDGTLETGGLLLQDGAYVTPAYGRSSVTIDLAVEHGAGNVTLELVD